METNEKWQKELERVTPTLLINPRFLVERLPSGAYVLRIYAHRDINGQLTTTFHEIPVTSRAAHELFEELVGVLSQEGYATVKHEE